MKSLIFEGKRTEKGERIVLVDNSKLDSYLNSFNHSRFGFDWGYEGAGSLQLSFAILRESSSDNIAKQHMKNFQKEIVGKLNKNGWKMYSSEIQKWLKEHNVIPKNSDIISKRSFKKRDGENIVKSVCKELEITQKKLAAILEVPEGTVSSWAVKNELPRLAKKAIEFYIVAKKNEEIVKKLRELVKLVSD